LLGKNSPKEGIIESHARRTQDKTRKGSDVFFVKQNFTTKMPAIRKIAIQQQIDMKLVELARQIPLDEPAIIMYIADISTTLFLSLLVFSNDPW
tara:strand:- start:140 stop:421 length:282 start_codon:yes stop_codon:yes gene_type:complete